jgi:pimeloyl-ACP methyl ester carboxylesterase
MREVDVRPGVKIAYEEDWFGPAWTEPETLLCIHGVAESSQAWRQWVPVLSGRLRLIRIDVPGFGRSTAPQDYDWHWKTVAPDIAAFLDKIGVRRTHVVAAKYGGCLAMGFAITYPDRVITLGLFSSPGGIPDVHKKASGGPLDLISTLGVQGWAAKTMRSRLGHGASEAQVKWWADELMGKAEQRAVYGASSALAKLDFGDGLSRITAPTLVVTTTESGLQDIATARAYQQKIARSDLQVMSNDCYHIAAVAPEDCARRLLAFIESHPN